jgi:hypothetical protein
MPNNWGSKAKDRHELLDRLESQLRWEGDCLLWTGTVTGNGYGIVYFEGRYWGVHRLYYMLKSGEGVRDGVVRHLCNNPLCLNLEHLVLGTQKENIQDQIQAGTFLKAKRDNSLVTEELKSLIINSTKTLQELSDYSGLSISYIGTLRSKLCEENTHTKRSKQLATEAKRLHGLGFSPSRIAEELSVSQRSVRRYLKD